MAEKKFLRWKKDPRETGLAAIAACPEMMDVLDALASCQWQEEITSIRERAISVLQRIPKNGEKK